MPVTKKRSPLVKAGPIKEVKKTTETKIKEYLKKEGYSNVSITEDWELDLGDDYQSPITQIITDSHAEEISFNVSTTKHCCGLREIGNINLTNTILPRNLYVDLLTKMLRNIVNQHKQEDGQRIALCFTVPINNNIYELFIEATLKVGFIEKGEWINSNSGNTLKHFINI